MHCNWPKSEFTTDIQGRSQNLHHFYHSMWLKLRVLDFSSNQNNSGLSGAYVTCIYCSLSVKISTRKSQHIMRRSWRHCFAFVFCVCRQQKPKDPQFEPHDWRRHYTGAAVYKVWDLPYICGFYRIISHINNVYGTIFFDRTQDIGFSRIYRKFLSNRIGASKRDIWTRAGNVIAPSLKY